MQPVIGEFSVREVSLEETRELQARLLRLPWDCRRDQCLSGMATIATKSAKGVGELAGMVVDLLGLKRPGALFVGMRRNQTVQDRLIQEYRLRKVYGIKLATDTRTALDDSTSISEDSKVGIISRSITDRETKRTTALAEDRDNGAKQAGKDAKK